MASLSEDEDLIGGWKQARHGAIFITCVTPINWGGGGGGTPPLIDKRFFLQTVKLCGGLFSCNAE